MTAVEFSNLTLALGARTVLADVNLAVAGGEFIGLFGPNGSGKTTLLRAILGLVKPSRGTIRVLGEPAKGGNPAIGYLPQQHGAPAGIRLRGRDFVGSAVCGQRLGLPRLDPSGQRELDRALDCVGARDLARRPLSELSGGERQRLLLAQALIGMPRILLLDEPLITLDLSHQRTVIEVAKSLQTNFGITILFSAHELNPLLGVIDRVLYLGSGHAAIGSVKEVINGPTLSRLYGTEIEVLHHEGRIFVMSGGYVVERHVHAHELRHDA